jgi:hypothetical protein
MNINTYSTNYSPSSFSRGGNPKGKKSLMIKIDFPAAFVFLAALVNGFAQPVITKQPTNETASLFADATFRVAASGDAPLSYQWRFNDSDLAGMTTTKLTVTNVQRTNAGNYNVVVTNLSGSITSQVATLTITLFNSIYCFGFSWTDTQGLAPDGSPDFANNDPQYWQNRTSNGPMWPEFFSTNLGLAYDATHNYARGGANSSDILNEVVNYPAPPKPELSLYCLWTDMWPGDTFSIFLNAVTNVVAGSQLIQTEIANHSNWVSRLYLKGARTILMQMYGQTTNAQPFIRSQIGTNSVLLSNAIAYIERYNTAAIDSINMYSRTRPDLRLLLFGWAPKRDQVLANPAQYGFTKTDISALDDPALTDKSFTGPGADYMYWDGRHATSKLHKLIAAWNLEVLANSIVEELDMMSPTGSPTIRMNHLQIGRGYTLQESVDLRNWQEAFSFTASAGTNQWTAPSGHATPTFYRLKWHR